MGGSEWTVDTLKEYVESRLASQQAEIERAGQTSLQSVRRADTLLPRQEYDARHESLTHQLSTIAARLDSLEGTKQGQSIAVAWIAAGIGTAVAVVAVVLGTIIR